MKAKRQPGYYWVQENMIGPFPKLEISAGPGSIGYWNGDEWLLIGSENYFSDEHLFAIDEHLLCSPFPPEAAAPGNTFESCLSEREVDMLSLSLFGFCMKAGPPVFIAVERLCQKLGIISQFEFYTKDWIAYANKKHAAAPGTQGNDQDTAAPGTQNNATN